MKKIFFSTILLLFFSHVVYSQFGCGSAVAITDGYTNLGITTPGNGGIEDWNTNPASTCGINTSYWDDDVYLFSYTAGASDELIAMEVFSRNNWNGVGIFTDCDMMTETFSNCLDDSGSSSTSNFTHNVSATVTAGTTVYIAVGQWGTPDDLDFDVVSFSASSCFPATYSLGPDPMNPTTGVEIDVINLGSATAVNITNDINADSETNVGIGTYTFTGFMPGDLVTITVTDNTDPTCSSSQVYALPPANDECINATSLTVNADLNCGSFVTGTIQGATSSADSETCSGTFDDDVWYSFVATGTSHEIQCNNITGSTSDLVFQLSEGTCGSLTELDCHDTPNSGFTATGLMVGNTYYVRVATFTSTGGQTTSFEMCIGTPPSPPANDDCVDALPLLESPDNMCANIVSGTTISATQSGESTLCSTFSNDDDVWYSFTPSSTNIYWFEVSNTSTTTYVNIYSGTCAGGLSSIGNSCFTSTNFASLTMGITYLVQVNTSSGSGATTDFDLCAYPNNAPTNDECTNAAALIISADDGCTTLNSGTTSFATQSTETTLCSTSANNDDVWYTITPTETKEHFFEISNTTSTTYVNIYDGTCAGGLTSIGSSCFTSNNSAMLTMGATYLVQVYTSSSSASTFSDFDLCVYPSPYPIEATVTCGMTLNQTHCYSNNDIATWLFTSSDGISGLNILFNAGDIESCCDQVTIYEGTDNTGTVLYDGNNGGDMTGVSITSSGPNIFMEIDSDFGASCASGSLCCTNPLDWDVTCVSCSPGAGSAVFSSCDVVNSELSIDVTVTDFGDGTIVISNDGGVADVTVDNMTPMPVNIGPFAFGTINVTLEHGGGNTSCDVNLDPITISGCPPANDDCSNAIALTVNSDLNCAVSTPGSIEFALPSSDIEACAGTFDDDVWYSFVATSAFHEIQCNNITGSTSDLVFQLSEGICGNLTELDCHDTPNSGFTATGLTVGNTYYVRVATFTSTGGQTTSFDMCIGTPPPPPSNDQCVDAITLMESSDSSCNNSLSGTTIDATQSGETSLCSTFSNDDDVWYSFTPSQTGIYVFELSNTSTGTYVHIYSGTCAGGLTSIGTCFSTDDNEASLTMGNTYLVQVHTSSSSITTDFDICAYPKPPPPPNDDCSNAIVVTETDFNCMPVTSGTTNFATQSSETSLCSTFSNDDDVWYSFTPMITGNYNFELSNTTTGTYVHVYSGTCAGGLTSLGSCFATTSNDASLTMGTTYLVQVHTSSSSITTDFDLCIYPDPTCAEPSGLTASNESLNGADIEWMDNAGASLFDLEFVVAGNPPTGVPTVSGVTSPYTWMGGMSSTSYEVYVRADCTMSDFSPWVGPTSFETLCDVFVPDYCEDFENGVAPTCWEEASNTDGSGLPIDFGSGSWQSDDFANDNTISGFSARANLFSNTLNDWIISPDFDLSVGNHEVSYMIALTGFSTTNIDTVLGSDDIVEFLITDDDGASWTVLQTWDNTSTISSTGEAVNIDLTSYTGTVRLAFRAYEGTVNDPNDVNFFVDDFCVESIPCDDPTMLMASNETSIGADLSWMGPMGAVMDLEILPMDNTPTGTPTVMGVNSPYTWMGGMPETAYDYYIRSDCGSGSLSNWVGPVSFTTTAGSPCPPSLTLTGTNTGDNSDANNMADNESSGNITSDQIIAGSATIDYDSATDIDLLPGFETMMGAVFEAFIDGCNDGGGGSNAKDGNGKPSSK